ncbi:hypothetical protein [Acidiferrobacter sp.]|uniref:hypothetical protein n=1 Tax=Acidiferrobacter sp. TaxID=1872107 RepID=UPI00261A269D|nr:hypothetical protein [Acidiferrobacter sp.]
MSLRHGDGPHGDLPEPRHAVVRREAQMPASIDDFRFMGFPFFACMPLAFVFRHTKPAVKAG